MWHGLLSSISNKTGVATCCGLLSFWLSYQPTADLTDVAEWALKLHAICLNFVRKVKISWEWRRNTRMSWHGNQSSLCGSYFKEISFVSGCFDPTDDGFHRSPDTVLVLRFWIFSRWRLLMKPVWINSSRISAISSSPSDWFENSLHTFKMRMVALVC